MFCPVCRYEYIEGIKECPDCGVPLVEELNEPDERARKKESIELVTVLETGDTARLLVAKSILEGAGIRYFAKGEGLQDLFGLGRFGTGFNPLMGLVKLQVEERDAEAAKELLKEL